MENNLDIKRFAEWLWANGSLDKSQFGSAANIELCLEYAQSLGCVNKSEILEVVKDMTITKRGGVLKHELSAQTIIALVQKSGLLEDKEYFFLNDKGEKICYENKNLKDKKDICVVRLKRKGQDWYEYFLSSEELRESGGKELDSGGWDFPSKNKAWIGFSKQMWLYRTIKNACRILFPDVLKNMQSSIKPAKSEVLDEFNPKPKLVPIFKPKTQILKPKINEDNLTVKLEPPKVVEDKEEEK